MLEKALGTDTISVELGGRKFELSPLTLRDWAELRSWAKRRRIELVNSLPLTAEQKSQQIEKILDSRPEIVTDKKTGQVVEVRDPFYEDLASEEGTLMMFYLSARRRHKDLKLEDIDIPLSRVAELAGLLTRLSGVEENADRPPQAAQ